MCRCLLIFLCILILYTCACWGRSRFRVNRSTLDKCSTKVPFQYPPTSRHGKAGPTEFGSACHTRLGRYRGHSYRRLSFDSRPGYTEVVPRPQCGATHRPRYEWVFFQDREDHGLPVSDLDPNGRLKCSKCELLHHAHRIRGDAHLERWQGSK